MAKVKYPTGILEIKDIAGNIPTGELFSDDFMKEYTQMERIDDFFTLAGTVPAYIDDLPGIRNPYLDKLVKAKTEFLSWQHMLLTASDFYIAKHIK